MQIFALCSCAAGIPHGGAVGQADLSGSLQEIEHEFLGKLGLLNPEAVLGPFDYL